MMAISIAADSANRFGDLKQTHEEFIHQAPSAASSKFALMDVDLGTIEIPANWSLDDFRKANEESFCYYNPDLIEARYPTPKWAVGKRYSVRAFQQIAAGTTTSRERLDFLESKDATSYLGAQGVALVYREKHTLIPKGKDYSSFTEGDFERVLNDLSGGVPRVDVYSDGGFNFHLSYLGKSWYRDSAFLGFSELPLDA
jgi:hypothetical protein